MNIGVVLSTYERPHLLALALEGYRRQTDQDFELVIADDGSGHATREVIVAFAQTASFPVRHAWHAHEQFRLAAVRNMGIHESSAAYIIFSDGDAIPPKDFVAMHRRHCRPGRFAVGGYVRLSEKYTATLTPEKVAAGDFVAQITPEDRRRLWWRHFLACWYNLTGSKDRPRIIGMNFAVWRADLFALNGFDENYVGWGREDSDMRTRMRRHGLGTVSLWNRSIVYHMHHPPEESRKDAGRNVAYYYTASKTPRCSHGLERELVT